MLENQPMPSSYPRPIPSYRPSRAAANYEAVLDWQVSLFVGPSIGDARKSASEWLQNFSDHGPLEIKSITRLARFAGTTALPS
jgi:hypothetical protein